MHKWLIIIIITLITSTMAPRVNINDNALDLLPGEAVRGDLKILAELGLVNRLIITLSLDHPPQSTEAEKTLRQSVLMLGQELVNSPLYTNVLYRLPSELEQETYRYVLERLPLLLTKDDYIKIRTKTTDEGISQALTTAFTLLNSPAGYGMQRIIQQDPLGLTPLFLDKLNHLRAEYDLAVQDTIFLSADGRHALIIAESTKSLTDADQARLIEEDLKQRFSNSLASTVSPMVIGSLPHTLANADAVQHDLKTLLPLATILLLFLLLWALRSTKSLIVLAIPFLAAPPAVILTAYIFHQLSALALGFGIVLLGIAVDFSIHLYLGLRASANRQDFLRQIRRPIILATVTTTSVFIVLLFSQVPSHRQMATLALSGIILAVTYSWVLIPTIARGSRTDIPCSRVFSWPSLSSPTYLTITIIWLGFIICGFFSWPHLSYNGNLQTLDAPSSKVIQEEKIFKSIWGQRGTRSSWLPREEILRRHCRRITPCTRALPGRNTHFRPSHLFCHPKLTRETIYVYGRPSGRTNPTNSDNVFLPLQVLWDSKLKLLTPFSTPWKILLPRRTFWLSTRQA